MQEVGSDIDRIVWSGTPLHVYRPLVLPRTPCKYACFLVTMSPTFWDLPQCFRAFLFSTDRYLFFSFLFCFNPLV